MQPIWKDKYYTINKTSAQFRIRLSGSIGTVIYTGKANARPGQSSIRVRINDICADYIRASLPVFGREFTPTGYSTAFYVEYLNGSTWTSAGAVTEFSFDWSYDRDFDPDVNGLAHPVSGKVDGRQFIVHSTATDEESLNATIVNRDGTSLTVVLTVHYTADFNDDYNNDFSIVETAPSPGTVTLDLSSYPNAASVTIEGVTYTVDDGCHDYVLYYFNAYGGWDSLLVRGAATMSDRYTRHAVGVEYDNTLASARGEREYLNTIERTYTLQSGWLTDEGSKRMHHLLGSTFVYLHDLAHDEIIPVNITNGDAPYKTYKSNGRKLVNYAITAKLAQDRMRR